MKTAILSAGVVLGFFLLAGPCTAGDTPEAETVKDGTEVLNDIMAIPARRIPESLLADAQGLVIIPGLVKGSFIVGVRYGRGIVVVRDGNGIWQPPQFVSLTGGSVGYQIGLQLTDIILVFKTRNSVQGLLSGKFTVGADAAAAAGPVGREAAAATDATLKAEILTYSRSRGLFAGVSLDGSVVRMEPESTAIYYAATNAAAAAAAQGAGPAQAVTLPVSAAVFLNLLTKFTTPPAALPPGSAPPPVTVVAAIPAGGQALGPQRQLAEASLRLHTVLDASWRAYLALPAEVYAGDRQPSAEAMGASLARFDAVARDPRYALLARTPEFQATHDLLRSYMGTASRTNGPTLALPSPPR